jgi:hypothetical protein
VKRRKKELDPKNCNVMEKQNEPVAKTCDEHRSKEPTASGGRSVQSVQNVQDMPVMPEIRLSNLAINSGRFNSRAIKYAHCVLPQPGGPYKSSVFETPIPSELSLSAFL